MLVAQDGQFNVYDANPGGKDSKKTIDTAGMVVDRVPAEEWAEIFREAWRRYRDYLLRREHERLRLGGPAPAV